MRWLMFALLAVVMVTLQTTVAPKLEWFHARPDWLLVVVIFIALHAQVKDAVVAGWLLGAAADLMSLERLGLISLSYGLAALAVVSFRDYLFRDRAVTQFTVTLFAGLLVRTAWTVYRRLLYDPATSLVMDGAVEVVVASVYTALWAPLIHKALLRVSGLFGFARPRYSYAGLHRLRGRRV